MSTAKGVLAVGLGLSLSHLMESAFDLGAAKDSTDKRKNSFSYRKVDGVMGVSASVLSIIQTSAIFAGKYRVARTASRFALAFAVSQLLMGSIAYYEQEPGHNGSDLLLAGLQTGFVIFGWSYSWFSLPALVARARGRDDRALTKIFMRWYEHRDPAAARELSRLAVENPHRFAANHSDVLFSDALDDSSARCVLSKLLQIQEAGILASSPLVGRAIESRPGLFLSADIKPLLGQLRSCGDGPTLLGRLIANRPELAEEVIEKAPEVFRGKDWELFGSSLQSIWTGRLSVDQKGRLLRSWRGSLTVGYENGMRPIRDLYRTLERDQYSQLVDDYFHRGFDVLRTGGNLDATFARTATPLLEDAMIYCYQREAPSLMEGVGMMVRYRQDVDIGAFDFLFRSYHQPTSLRRTALRLLDELGGQTHVNNQGVLTIMVHDEPRVFGQAGLFDGWFRDPERTLAFEHDLLAALREPPHTDRAVLKAIARYHRLPIPWPRSGGLHAQV